MLKGLAADSYYPNTFVADSCFFSSLLPVNPKAGAVILPNPEKSMLLSDLDSPNILFVLLRSSDSKGFLLGNYEFSEFYPKNPPFVLTNPLLSLFYFDKISLFA